MYHVYNYMKIYIRTVHVFKYIVYIVHENKTNSNKLSLVDESK